MSRNFSKRWSRIKKDRGIRITFQAKPSQVHGRGEGTRVRWAARLEADERISRVSLNTRRTSSRLLLAWRVCVGVPWRTSRGKANRLHTHTRSRDRRESPHYRATHSPFLTSCACPSRLFVCFRSLILFYPLPLSLHWNLFPLFPNIFGNSIRVLIVILFISKKSMRQYFLTIRWIFRDREIQGRIYIYNADKDIRYPVS